MKRGLAFGRIGERLCGNAAFCLSREEDRSARLAVGPYLFFLFFLSAALIRGF